MTRLLAALRHHRDDERGVTALEYSLIAGLVGLVISAALMTIGTRMSALFAHLGTVIGSA